MEENNLNIAIPQSENPVAPENRPPPPPMPVSKPKGNPVLIFLSMLLIILVGAVVFLGYQNYQLQKQITLLQATPSPTPTASQAPNGDLANWKTYTNTKFGFEIQYPPDAKITGRDPDPFPVSIQIDNFIQGNEVHGFPVGWMVFISEPQSNPNNLSLLQWAKDKSIIKDQATQVANTKIGGQSAIYWRLTGGDVDILDYLIQDKNKMTLITINPATGYEKTINQILSTFKFLGTATPSATPVSKACTMEVKLCPNGSYVGRSGPNCKFAACTQ